MWDAIVAGAGPAGAVAAFMLARRGWRVLLADRTSPAVHKFGEALPGAAVRLLHSLGLPAPVAGGAHARIGGNLSSWNCDDLIAVDFLCDPFGPGWRLDRPRFDADLRAAARAAGVIERAAWVSDIGRQGDGWQVRCDDGSVERARWIVDATGRRATLARRLGAGRRRDSRVVALYSIGEARSAAQFDRTLVEAAPDGWWYGARLPSGVPIVGFHTHAREAARLKDERRAWALALADTRHVRTMLAPSLCDCPLRGTAAGGARLTRFSGDGWIACGDAAMSFDPISGQGIYAALWGGMTAGTAVADAIARDAATADDASARMEEVWDIYRVRCFALYRSERRWPFSPFWSMFAQAAA